MLRKTSPFEIDEQEQSAIQFPVLGIYPISSTMPWPAIAISQTKFVFNSCYTFNIGIYNLLTQKTLSTNLTIGFSESFSKKDTAQLPNNQFAVAIGDKIQIYCAETEKLVTEISLPFTVEERFIFPSKAVKRIMHTDLSASKDGEALYVRSDFNANKVINFVINLKTYKVIRFEGSIWQSVNFVNKNYLISLVKLDKVEIIDSESKEVKANRVSGIDSELTQKIFAWPQHPSVWIVAIKNFRKYELWIYDISINNGTTTAKFRNVLGKINYENILECVTHHHALVFQDSLLGLSEYDVGRNMLRPIRFKGITSAEQRCVFPNGELAVTGIDEEKKPCLVLTELESSKCFEEDLANEIDKTFLTLLGSNGLTRPLRSIVAAYAKTSSAFFSHPQKLLEVHDKEKEKTLSPDL